MRFVIEVFRKGSTNRVARHEGEAIDQETFYQNCLPVLSTISHRLREPTLDINITEVKEPT